MYIGLRIKMHSPGESLSITALATSALLKRNFRNKLELIFRDPLWCEPHRRVA